MIDGGTVWALAPVFFAIAAVYSSVGFGGGTGYLAVMALASFPPAVVPPIALSLNLLVTGTSLVRFGLAGRVPRALLAPFLAAGIPAALACAYIEAPRTAYQLFLGLGLVAAAFALVIGRRGVPGPLRPPGRRRLWAVGLPVGAIIGGISGFVGFGGGVFFGPFLLLNRWEEPRRVSAACSVMILALSAVGLAAHGTRLGVPVADAWPLGAAVLAGAVGGAHLGTTRLPAIVLQRVMAAVVALAGGRAVIAVFGI
ncbi:MAG: sulfite exporter TauE/SafE family protein [Deltaproteobacteria bacterium]|nr:sulfite exporter TauE/SafE family protein [Deltaproteobacteria bacterium]